MARIDQKKVLPGRDGVWYVIRQLQVFTISDLLKHTKVGEGGLQIYLRLLMKCGYIVIDRKVKSRAAWMYVYRLVRDVGIHAPQIRTDCSIRPPTIQARIWMALKTFDDFTVKDVCLVTEAGEDAVRAYLTKLHVFGFLTGRGQKPVRYRLVGARDRGPLPPVLRNDGKLFDRNTGKVYLRGGAEEKESEAA